MGHLAVAYCGLGKLKNAEELQMVALEKWIQIRGEDHPSALLAREKLDYIQNAL
jgi:hypothetical protein